METNELTELEAGRRRASAEELKRFCDAFGIRPSDIYAGLTG